MNFVRAVGRIALALLVLGLCAITLYGLWRVLRVYWPAVLFYGYMVPVALILVFGAVNLLRQAPFGLSARDRVMQIIRVASDDASKLAKIRRTAGAVLDGISTALTWPAHLFSSIRSVEAG